jgi:hypothetical protein
MHFQRCHGLIYKSEPIEGQFVETLAVDGGCLFEDPTHLLHLR